ncbi:MAG TPA: ABC transporter permease [Polyangiaceae bacterium]
MSAQTGVASLPPPPPSLRGMARLRDQVARLTTDPNPVWMRELRAAARLQRTPIILAVITGMMTLLVCSVGGISSMTTEPARVGVWLYQTFFSLAFALVTWMGPAVAATTIAAERSGRTWEALELTGLGASRIARGKFLASLTYVSLYLVMLAPVGALPFLFGGVTAFEVLLAFLVLAAAALLSVAFGLAMSSKFASPALAILVTLLFSIPSSIVAYVGLGLGLSYPVSERWPGVEAGSPVWLPSAYVRADFGIEYLTLLVVGPFLLVLLPAWLFHEITIANMAAPSDDRSTRLRLWALVASVTLTALSLAGAVALKDLEWLLACVLGLTLTHLFVAFLFAGEPLGPSRRVLVHWDRLGVGAGWRFLGPGLIRAFVLELLLIAGSFGALMVAAFVVVTPRKNALAVVSVSGYAAAFLLFVVGFAAWTRARSRAAGVPRVLLLGALFLALVGPWIAMAIAGIFETTERAMLVAAPSPLYAIHVLRVIRTSAADRDLVFLAAAVSAASWALMGLGLLALARARVARRLRAEQEERAELAGTKTT